MPARSTDSLLQIEESLHSSLKKGHHSASSLSERLISANKRILLQHIEFRQAGATSSAQLEKLKSKYASINPSTGPTDHVKHSKDMDCMKTHDDDLPDPKVVLYPPEKVKLEWPAVRRIGAGLTNLGNTCFLNSTLQCLTYTPPLVNYLSSSEHAHTCKQVGFCMVCELQRHIRRCFENGGQAIKPHAILQKIKLIAKHMHWGRQEDAHEFLRYVIDAMQKSCLNGNPKLDRISKETTVINQIFGGFLRSQVVCLKCKAKSNTYDPFLDISVDVKNVPNIQKAFEKFVQPEQLDLDNAYNCTKCKQKVAAQKRFTIHKPSNALTIQLKRYGVMGGKVTRHISFPEKLNIRPYMSVNQGPAITYQLYAVLVHMGHSTNSGHYYCYVRSSNQAWYCMNDSMVQQTSQGRVLNSEAYMLFYIRCDAAANHEQPKQSPVIGPKLPQNKKHFQNEDMESAPQTADVGSPIPRPKLIGPVKPPSAALGKPASPNVPVPRPTSITTQREKISFGIKPKCETPKPRIVMHIKNGKVVHNSSVKKPTPLVPYDTEEEDESSEEDKQTLDVNATTDVPGSYGPLVKRERLTVNTVLPVNATTKWQVVGGDQMQSPSGNSSNSSSTHSTTEWHITSAKAGSLVLPEAQHIGWTVTDKEKQHSSIFTAILDQMQNNKNKKKADSDDSPMFSPSTRSPSPGDHIDLAPLINGHYEEEEETHKKHKKQKKEKKKKKKKKHKRRDEDKEPLIDKEDGEISDSPPPSKRSSPQQAEEEASAPVKTNKSHAPVYEWDQHMKKKDKNKERESNPTYRHQGLPALAPKWDGRKQPKGSEEDDVLEHLQRNSYGYGSQVSSWEGGESEVNIAAHVDRRQTKRHWDDEYEEELDRGKTKKVKLHHEDEGYRGYHGNQFQKYQDRRNGDEDVRTGAIYNKNYYHDNRSSSNRSSNYGYQGASSSSSSYHGGGDRHHSNNNEREYGHHRNNYNHRSSFGKKNHGYAERYS